MFSFQEKYDTKLRSQNTQSKSHDQKHSERSKDQLFAQQNSGHDADNLLKSKLFNVSRNSGLLTSSPSLDSISYQANKSVIGRAIVYTVDIPISELRQPIKSKHTDKVRKLTNDKTTRFISSVNVSIENIGDEESVHSSESNVRIKAITPVKYKKVTYDDLDPETDDLDKEVEGHGDSGVCKSQSNDNIDGAKHLLSDKDNKSGFVYKTKEEIITRRRSKEALVAAKSQTADWLLNNGGQSLAFSTGRPNWASTPNLKNKKNYDEEAVKKTRFKKEAGHSFDLLLGEDTENEQSDNISSDVEKQSQNTVLSRHSVDGDYKEYLTVPSKKPHLRHLQGDSACSSMDDSVDMSKTSLIGSSCGIPEEQLNYLRLARLVNGPSPIMVSHMTFCNLHFSCRYSPRIA